MRRLGEAERVDENTLFGVASTTKAMTAAALGMLVGEGRARRDNPVVRHSWRVVAPSAAVTYPTNYYRVARFER